MPDFKKESRRLTPAPAATELKRKCLTCVLNSLVVPFLLYRRYYQLQWLGSVAPDRPLSESLVRLTLGSTLPLAALGKSHRELLVNI